MIDNPMVSIDNPVEQIFAAIKDGSYDHAIGQKMNEGETGGTSYGKTQIIDVEQFRKIVVHNESDRNASTCQCHFAEADFVIDIIQSLPLAAGATIEFTVPVGAKYARLRGYADFLSIGSGLTVFGYRNAGGGVS